MTVNQHKWLRWAGVVAALVVAFFWAALSGRDVLAAVVAVLFVFVLVGCQPLHGPECDCDE